MPNPDELLKAGIMPMAPGAYLASRVLPARRISPAAAAAAMEMPPETLGRILEDRLPIDSEAAKKIGRLVGTTDQFWLNMQASWDFARHAVPAREIRSLLHAHLEVPVISTAEARAATTV